MESENGVYAFGKTFATRGAARFKTEDTMWKYLRGNEAKEHFVVDGARINMNRDVRTTPADEARTKAVRKLVRAIIEVEGGNPTKTKYLIDADYRRGIVRYKDIRVGEYKDELMNIKEAGAKYEAKCKLLVE